MGRIQPVDALLVIDVGNTRIHFATFDEDGLHDPSDALISTPDSWPTAVTDAWQISSDARQRQVVIGSVAPQAASTLATLVEEHCGLDPLFIRDDIPLPLELAIDGYDEVGVDRVCAAAAAFDRVQGACAVASFGSATTIDCVSADGKFLGGAILPGFEMAFQAMHERTAQLPRIEFERPNSPFGKNTHEAMINGVIYGTVGALREMVERFATELNEWPPLFITGGNAGVVSEQADFIDAVVPHLTLMGIASAYRKAARV
jgi:type III pantothenate kinase